MSEANKSTILQFNMSEANNEELRNPVGVELYCRQVFEVRSTEKACVNPFSPSNPCRVVVQPSNEGCFFWGGYIMMCIT